MNLKPLAQKHQLLQWFWSRGCKHICIYNESRAAGTKAAVFAMMLTLWLQKHKYSQWIRNRWCKNNSIYDDFEAVVWKNIVNTEWKCRKCFQNLSFCTRSRLKFVFSKVRLKKRFSYETVCKSWETCHFFSCFIASRFWCKKRFFLEKKFVHVSKIDQIGTRASPTVLWQLSRAFFAMRMSK